MFDEHDAIYFFKDDPDSELSKEANEYLRQRVPENGEMTKTIEDMYVDMRKYKKLYNEVVDAYAGVKTTIQDLQNENQTLRERIKTAAEVLSSKE